MSLRFCIVSISFMLLSYTSYGQCAACNVKEDQFSDYCYLSPTFEGYCALFSEKSSSFRLVRNKKTLKMPETEVFDTAYFLSVARDKKLKISGEDMLFLQQATKQWAIEKRKYGHTYTQSGLGYKILSKGSGEMPEKGKPIKVHYTGYLEDGTKFDSSLDRNTPFSFILGQGQVIKGWDEGVAMLPIGTKAILRIPPDLGYGSMKRGAIPANATLFFEIDILE